MNRTLACGRALRGVLRRFGIAFDDTWRLEFGDLKEKPVVPELAALAFASFVVALSGALMPGPVLAVTLAGSRRHGFWFGPRVVLGHALVELPLVLLLYWGLGEALKSSWIVILIGSVGAVAMAVMAVGMLCQTRRVDDPDAHQGGVLRLGAVPSGAVTSLLNPYWYLWWVTIGAVMVTSVQTAGWLGLVVFFAGHISGDLGWYSMISFGVSRGRRYLQGRLYKGLLIGCSLILLAMAALFAKLAAEKILAVEAG